MFLDIRNQPFCRAFTVPWWWLRYSPKPATNIHAQAAGVDRLGILYRVTVPQTQVGSVSLTTQDNPRTRPWCHGDESRRRWGDACRPGRRAGAGFLEGCSEAGAPERRTTSRTPLKACVRVCVRARARAHSHARVPVCAPARTRAWRARAWM